DGGGWAREWVQPTRFTDRDARQLWGGQQQRVALARAIVFHPQVVLMDEPLGALDKNLRFEMQVEIKEIQQRLGMTVLYVTHDQEEAMSMSDRIAILNRGRIDQVGPPGEVYERPANPFVARLLGEPNLIEGTIAPQFANGMRLVLPSGHELRVPSGSRCSGGARGMLFIRPERIEITLGANAAGDPRYNELAGRIRRCAFLGNILRYAVDIDGTAPVTVDLQNAGVAPLPVRAPVGLRWPVTESLILPGET